MFRHGPEHGRERKRGEWRQRKWQWKQWQWKLKEQGIEVRGGGPDEAPECYKKLLEVLDQHQGNASAAVRAAKLARSHFYRLLSKHGLVGRGDVSDR